MRAADLMTEILKEMTAYVAAAHKKNTALPWWRSRNILHSKAQIEIFETAKVAIEKELDNLHLQGEMYSLERCEACLNVACKASATLLFRTLGGNCSIDVHDGGGMTFSPLPGEPRRLQEKIEEGGGTRGHRMLFEFHTQVKDAIKNINQNPVQDEDDYYGHGIN